MMGCMKHCISK